MRGQSGFGAELGADAFRIEPDTARKGLHETQRVRQRRQRFMIIGFDGHQVAHGHAGFAGQIGQFAASGSASFGQQGTNRQAPIGTLRISSISLFVFDHPGEPQALTRTWPLSSSGVNNLQADSPVIAAVQHPRETLDLPLRRACPMGAADMAGAMLAILPAQPLPI